ncbi:hypothetical protein LSTR_LSTR003896 [Laodelphax striatellus]|uniref:Major facilitator superfamily (MFS) profile domain-containing protein n=1 Tax=Laodelphax striatellus TaxID=195883 RepID=A0A482X9Z0_LAOST|nr:hypothetical protein LSTR_LSTR003896 [Laodelphax striatellus]
MAENASNVTDVNNLKGQNEENSDTTLKETEKNNHVNGDQKTDCNNQTNGIESPVDDLHDTKHAQDVICVDNRKIFEMDDEDHHHHRCGLFSFSPDWLQPFTSKKSFVLFYGVLGMCQFALSTYFVATISTIEKRFKMPTRTSGLITSSTDLGYMAVLFCAYFGRFGNKPLWVAAGAMLCALSSFGKLLPHLLYGPGADALELGKSSVDLGDHNETISFEPAICSFMRSFGPMIGFFVSWIALDMYIEPSLRPSIGPSDPRWVGAWWFGWAPLGTMMVLFGISIAFFPRMLPRAAARQNQFKRAINQKIINSGMEVPEAAALILKETSKKEEMNQERTVKDLFKNIRRILKNKLFLLNVIASLCYMFGMMGYWAYLPKYMETQFHVSASEANIVSGAVGLVFSGIGLLASGAAITFFKPPARFLAGWNTFVEVIDAVGHYMYALIGCPDGASSFHGSLSDDFTCLFESPFFLDNVCLVWGETCGETGNCWIYDAEKMRYYLNFTSSTFLVLAAVADLGVYFLSKDLKIYDEEEESNLLRKKKKKKKDPEDGLEFDEMSKEAQLLILRAVQSPVAVKKSDIAPEE